MVEITPGESEARVRNFLGGYAALRRGARARRGSRSRSRAPCPEGSEADVAKPAKPAPLDKAKDKGKKKLSERVQALEREIEAAEAAVARLDWLAAEPDTAKDGERMREIAAERRAAADKVAALTDEWERTSTELDEASSRGLG